MQYDKTVSSFADYINDQLFKVFLTFPRKGVVFAPVILDWFTWGRRRGYHYLVQARHDDGVHRLEFRFLAIAEDGKAQVEYRLGQTSKWTEEKLDPYTFRGWLNIELQRLRDRDCYDVTLAGDTFIKPEHSEFNYHEDKVQVSLIDALTLS